MLWCQCVYAQEIEEVAVTEAVAAEEMEPVTTIEVPITEGPDEGDLSEFPISDKPEEEDFSEAPVTDEPEEVASAVLPVTEEKEAVVSVALPVLDENSKVFDFIMDPQGMITATGAARYGGKSFEEGATLYFKNTPEAGGEESYSSRSDELSIVNTGKISVNVLLKVRVDGLDKIHLSLSNDFAGSREALLFLAVIDNKGQMTPVGEEGMLSVSVDLKPAEGGDAVYEYNEEEGEYVLSEGDEPVYDRFDFALYGACNPEGDWSGIVDKPVITVTWIVNESTAAEGTDVSENEVSENVVPENETQEDEISENEVSENGISENKVSENEISGNEVSVNEISENGLSVNEISENGLSVNEISENVIYEEEVISSVEGEEQATDGYDTESPVVTEALNEEEYNIVSPNEDMEMFEEYNVVTENSASGEDRGENVEQSIQVVTEIMSVIVPVEEME